MRLTPDPIRQPNRYERTLLWGGLLLVAAVLVAGFFFKAQRTSPTLPGRIACDMETVEADYFLQDGFRFQGGQQQTSDRARSGRHSFAFAANGNVQYGLTFTIEQPTPGTVYEASVWSYNNHTQSAKLAVRGAEPDGLYIETAEAAQTDTKGWQELRIRFHVPFQNAPQALHIYVYANGAEQVWFDDLVLEQKALWDAKDFRPTQLHLEIDDKAWRQLSAKRDAALEKGILQTNDDDWAKARMTDNDGTERNVSLRLKGDWLDHLRGDKWSFRVKLGGFDAWRGMRTFSLHTPEARYFLHEWLLHRFWESQGVLTTRYDFVELIINGQSKGIYAYEEHFEKQLVESKERREGPIVKFSEEGYWAGMARQLDHHGFIRSGSGHSAQNPANAPVAAFNEAELLADTTQRKLYIQARHLLEQFRQGQQGADAIFDLDRLARFYAGCDMLHAYHGIVWHNQRFYYNPIMARLEPIGFDGFAERPYARYHFLAEGALHREAMESTSLAAYFLQDTAFMATYLAVLEELTRPQVWAAFLAENEAAWTARLAWIQLEFPQYQPSFDELTREVAFVRSHLLPYSETSLRTWATPDGQLMVENTHTLPIIVQGYGTSDKYMAQAMDAPVWLPAGPVRTLYSKLQRDETIGNFRDIAFWDQQAMSFQAVPTASAIDVPAQAKFLYFQIPGWDSLLTAPIVRLPGYVDLAAGQTYRKPSAAADFPTLQWDAAAPIVHIPTGTHTFTRDLVIAPGYTLHIAPGATINLNQGAAIISYGAVKALGQADGRIFITTSDGSGQGLQVLGAPTASVLHHVVFQGLRNLHKGDWMLTGAVTFHEAAVQMSDCSFLDNQSEDALNLVRTTFEMQRCRIQNASSDGLDTDFCKGKLFRCTFVNTVNDGVDFSGSIITIEDCRMVNNGDKGISAGEASDVTVRNTRIEGCPIGMASKDQSVVHAKDITLVNCQQGLVAFQKKPEFGPARLLVENLTAEGVTRLYQIAPGSRLQLD